MDGTEVEEINADLAGGLSIFASHRLRENLGLAFMGTTKGGAFELTCGEARELLSAPNPNGGTNASVIKPWADGKDLTQRNRGYWVIDFGCGVSEREAASYERPFELAKSRVSGVRTRIRQKAEARKWWLHNRPRPEMRAAITGLPRILVTTRVAKYRLFAWLPEHGLPDSATFCFALCDDHFFGVLQSSIHELWSRRMGTQLREAESGFRYTPTTCFETFPLPWAPGKEPKEDSLCKQIAGAAAELNAMRERWLNPPEWIDPIAAAVDEADDFADVPQEARPLIRQSAIMAAAAKDKNLRKRTLTNLYNERPTWLKLAHRKLDEAVLAAYAAVDPAGGWSPAWAAVWEDTGAGQPLPAGHPLEVRRPEVDQMVLANLLRMNQERSQSGLAR